MEYLWIVGLVLILAAVVVIAIRERKNLKSWLVFAVASAEKALGSGTGELKLRQVYDQFLDKFPVLSKFISFEMFSSLVDKALESLEDMLNTNEAVNTYIKGE
jgi:hypothetical protein